MSWPKRCNLGPKVKCFVLLGCYVPWNIKYEETALDRNNTEPVEEIFNDSKSVPSDCITGIKNRLFSGIIAGFLPGILSLLI